MSVLDIPRTQLDQPPVLVERVPSRAAVEQPRTSGAGRWFLLLGIPFVLGAFFFGLSIALNATWPMAPAFFVGPLLMILSYIYLCLSSEANSQT